MLVLLRAGGESPSPRAGRRQGRVLSYQYAKSRPATEMIWLRTARGCVTLRDVEMTLTAVALLGPAEDLFTHRQDLCPGSRHSR